MPDHIIPAQAVEAAIRTMPEYTPDEEADSFELETNDMCRAKVERILEAATPHMMAGAWDEAMKRATEVAWEHDASASSAVSQIPNPYRPTVE